MQILPPQIHKWIYFFGLFVVAVGLPLSEFLMSIGQLIIIANWLLEGQIPTKLKRFWENKAAVVAASVILMHLIGLLYTSDFAYAANDIRIKAPLLALPIIIAGYEPLSKTLFDRLLAIFVAAVTIGTFISMGVYYGVIHTKHHVVDIRDISIFISHIRFSLMICLSVFIAAYYAYCSSSLLDRLGLVLLIVWLITFMTILHGLTGIVALVVVVFALMLYGIFVLKNKLLKIFALFGVIVLILGLIMYMKPLISDARKVRSLDYTKVDNVTALGNEYTHDTINVETENGYRLWTYVSWKELEMAWNQRSKIDFATGKDDKGDPIKFIVVRYLTSKGERKDAAAVKALGDEEIKGIEEGVVNVNHIGRSGVTIRIMETLWEFRDYADGGNINGHSTVMRLEFWKAAIEIIKKHPIIGVGTGDVKNAYADQYNEMHSNLDAAHRLRSHNQLLSITVAFGIVGLIWFLFALFYPMIKTKMTFNYFYFVFFIIFFLSMISEDTLETQPGVTFYAFFSSVLLFGSPFIGSGKSAELA